MVRKPTTVDDDQSKSPKAASKPKGRSSMGKRKIVDDDEVPAAKKAKQDTKQALEGEQTTKDGQVYIQLGKQKRAGITTFKGSTYVDIREYYGPADDEKPGKKGIALNKDQWEVLKANFDKIDRLLAEVTE
ncbi:PC4-domain-containing protein [Pleurotus eryngii]|uniref:PC4-domain-containing protein n=1 Tax=Pleurotus eryngii TaxID=5323 RepID=A0A9P6DKZ9_PLEER|nr:PC4-domain-containing protein [Pleurotus eryngii]